MNAQERQVVSALTDELRRQIGTDEEMVECETDVSLIVKLNAVESLLAPIPCCLCCHDGCVETGCKCRKEEDK